METVDYAVSTVLRTPNPPAYPGLVLVEETDHQSKITNKLILDRMWISSIITEKTIMRKDLALAMLLSLVILDVAAARKWQVGPSRPYTRPSAVASLVGNGDTVEIDSTRYTDVCSWRANDLLLKGPSGRPNLDATGMQLAEGKAVWVIKGRNNTVDGIEFMGAACVDLNGAGIRIEGANLTVRNSFFHDNENGILGGADSTSEVIIEYSEFSRNGYGDGYSHNMYIGNIRSFTLRYCYSHHARVGHLVKSRAKTNYILYNRIMDEATGYSSRVIDLPNGGCSYLIGNLFHKGPNAQNSNMIGYGLEGISAGYDTTLYCVNNTMVNARNPIGPFVSLQTRCSTVLINNIFYGANEIVRGGRHRGNNNWVPVGHNGDDSLRQSVVGTDPRLVNMGNYDYHLDRSSACIDSGADPGSGLRPVHQYAHPCNREPRPTQGIIDIGSYEYVSIGVEEQIEARGKRQQVRLKVEPNPFISFTTISGYKQENFYVYDIDGRFVRNYRGERIGVGLPAGVYFIKARNISDELIRVVKLR